jgi:hypothetical protein
VYLSDTAHRFAVEERDSASAIEQREDKMKKKDWKKDLFNIAYSVAAIMEAIIYAVLAYVIWIHLYPLYKALCVLLSR